MGPPRGRLTSPMRTSPGPVELVPGVDAVDHDVRAEAAVVDAQSERRSPSASHAGPAVHRDVTPRAVLEARGLAVADEHEGESTRSPEAAASGVVSTNSVTASLELRAAGGIESGLDEHVPSCSIRIAPVASS